MDKVDKKELGNDIVLFIWNEIEKFKKILIRERTMTSKIFLDMISQKIQN